MPLFRKLPQRGFNRSRFQTPCSVVNLADLSKVEGDKIDLETLKQAGLIRPNSKSVETFGHGRSGQSLFGRRYFGIQISQGKNRGRRRIIRFGIS